MIYVCTYKQFHSVTSLNSLLAFYSLFLTGDYFIVTLLFISCFALTILSLKSSMSCSIFEKLFISLEDSFSLGPDKFKSFSLSLSGGVVSAPVGENG